MRCPPTRPISPPSPRALPARLCGGSLLIGALLLAGGAGRAYAHADTAPPPSAPSYTLIDLGDRIDGPPHYFVSSASGLNASGQVIGATDDDAVSAFRTAPDASIDPATDDLGALGKRAFNFAYTTATGVNASGQVVGYSITAIAPHYPRHAFRTGSDAKIDPATDDLGSLNEGGDYNSSQAFGINDKGQVVGYSDTAGGVDHAFRTAPNAKINPATDTLGSLGGDGSLAFGINDAGQAVGDSPTRGNHAEHAFRTAPNAKIDPATDDLGTLGGTYSVATGINDAGQVVGDSVTHGDYHPTHGYNSATEAFLYTGGHMYDLNSLIPRDSGVHLYEANAINDHGQIAATGAPPGANHTQALYRAYLLTPMTPVCGPADDLACGGGPQATPELDSGELLATGLLPLGAALLYRRRCPRRVPLS